MSTSTPVSQLTRNTDKKLGNQDLFLLSKQGTDSTYTSKSLDYQTLRYSLSSDIIPNIPTTALPIIDIGSATVPTSTDKAKIYSANTTTKLYTDLNTKCSKISDKLDMKQSTAQTVASKVTFNSTIKCKTTTATSGTDVVNVDYLMASKPMFPNAVLKTYIYTGNPWHNGDGVDKYSKYLPTPSSPYTAKQDCFVSFNINWDCRGNDSYACYIKNASNAIIKLFCIPPRETGGTYLDQFHGSFYLKKGFSFWFNVDLENKPNNMYYLYKSYCVITSLVS